MQKIILVILLLPFFIYPMSRKERLTWQLEDLIRKTPFDTIDHEKTTLNQINILLNEGANPEFALIIAAKKRNAHSVVETLLTHRADPNFCFESDFALLNAYDTSIAYALLNAGAQINMTDSLKETALMKAAETSKKTNTFIHFLLAHDADPNMKNFNGQTALMLALGRLNRANQEAHTMNPDQLTACYDYEVVEITKTLVTYGINYSLSDNNGQTTLMYSVKRGNPEIVRIILQAGGTNCSQQNKKGKSALDMAQDELKSAATVTKKARYEKIIEMLSNTEKIERKGFEKIP